MEDESEDKGLGIGVGIGIAIGIIIGALVFGNNKFEGMTAREWFDEYDWVVACIEESSNPKLDCI